MNSIVRDAIGEATRKLELQWAEEEEREVELTAAEIYARDPELWIEDNVIIASKFAASSRVGPVRMRLYPAQRKTIRSWVDVAHLKASGELRWTNVAIEKSRQIGETWLFAAVICWAMHYHDVHGLAMHTKSTKIDDGGTRSTIDSLFGRVRYIDKRLKRGEVPGLGLLVFRPFSREPAKIENADRDAFWVGEGQTDNPGRGDTFDAALVDEAAFVEHGEQIYAALDEACPDGKALLSTVNGDDNFHARICDERPLGWTYLRLHWSEHPIYSKGLHIAGVVAARQPTLEMAKAAATCGLCAGNLAGERWVSNEPRAHRFPGKLTSPHYDARVIGKTIEQVANELDIDREAALGGRVYGEFSTEVHVTEEPLVWDHLLPTELAWDYGLDCTSVVICQDAPTEYLVIGEVELLDRPGATVTPDVVSEMVRGELRELMLLSGMEPERIETFLEPEWTKRLYCRGDPSGDHRELASGRPLTAFYAAEGFRIFPPPRALTLRVDDSIRAVKRLFLGTPKPIRVSSRCELFRRHFANNVWPTDALGRRRIGASKPLDNEHNHMARAFAYLAVAKFPPPRPRSGLAPPDDDELSLEELDPRAAGVLRRRRRASADGFPEREDPLPYDSQA